MKPKVSPVFFCTNYNYIDKCTIHNAQCTIMERALRAYLNRDEITWFCLQIDADLV